MTKTRPSNNFWKTLDEAVLKNAETIFGKLVDVSTKTHIPLVKSPNEEYHDKPKYFKPKLRVDFNSKNILTKIFVKGTPVETKTINDVAKHVTWGSTIQMVILIEKVWASSSVFSDEQQTATFGELTPNNTKANFGVSLATLQINVVKEKELSQRSITLNAFYECNTFGQ